MLEMTATVTLKLVLLTVMVVMNDSKLYITDKHFTGSEMNT